MMLMSETGIMAEADARVFQMLMSANRTTRRLMAADRTVAGACRRVATLRRLQAAQASRDHARAAREVAKEFGGSGIAPGWGRIFTVKGESSATQAKPKSARSVARASTSRRAIRAYTGPLLDTRGRVALFMDIKYRGFKSKGWRPGLSADHIEYIMRELALELAEAQLGRPISNMGENVEEIMACWRALEEIERGYRANATVQYRIVWNLPAELNAEQRRDLVTSFCERTFGRLGLPYAAAIHTPDPEGDQRNFHAHITFSTRPCERTDDHQWAISEEKVNGLTDKVGLRLVRALGAAHMNRACREAGVQKLYTHQTYAQRGLNAERQAHVGGAGMAAHARGEHVGVVTSNAAIVEQNEAALAVQQVKQQLDATTHLQHLLVHAERASVRRSGVIAAIDAARQIQRTVAKIVGDAFASRPARSTTPSRALVSDLRARASVVGSQDSAGQHRRQAVAPAAALVDTTSQLIERLTNADRRSSPAVTSATAVCIVGVSAAICAKLVSTRPAQPGEPAQVRTISAVSAVLKRKITMLDQARDANARGRVALVAVERRITAHGETERNLRITQARTAVMTNPGLSCTVIDNQIEVDLSALAEADRRAFLALDAGVQRQLILDRHKADEQRREADLARQHDADRARASQSAAVRAAQLAEACRIVRETSRRPYRRAGKVLHPDWTGLTSTERETVTSVGNADPKLQAALLDRARADAQADTEALPRASVPRPGDRSQSDQYPPVADASQKPLAPADVPKSQPEERRREANPRLIGEGAAVLQHLQEDARRNSEGRRPAAGSASNLMGATGSAHSRNVQEAHAGTLPSASNRPTGEIAITPVPTAAAEHAGMSDRDHTLVLAAGQRQQFMAGWNTVRRFGAVNAAGAVKSHEEARAEPAQLSAAALQALRSNADRGR